MGLREKGSRAWAAWKRFGQRIGGLVGLGMFAVLYVVLFAPVALILKMRGRRFLPRFRGDEPSYFLPKDRIEPTLEFMRRQG